MRQQQKKEASPLSLMRCLVDDTILTRNIQEIETWVSQGLVVLVVPLYTLERLHILKKDSSQIGVNARKAVKFLDRFTSSRGDLSHDPIILQGPDEQYSSWSEVEAHYDTDATKTDDDSHPADRLTTLDPKKDQVNELSLTSEPTAASSLSQLLLDKLNFSKQPTAPSPTSTPPLSPPSSGPQSSKTSPEVKSATLIRNDKTPVPPALKPLLNPVVWYMHEKKDESGDTFFFLTNSADTIHLARDFAIPTKNIHQLRSALGLDETDAISDDKAKRDSARSTVEPEPKAKTLFSYNDVESDEEEQVVFKPRGRGSTPASTNGRGHATIKGRGRGKAARSPRPTFSTTTVSSQTKPQIPIEEIDPDSFDRGGFGRGSTPLANVGNHTHGAYNSPRTYGQRGTQTQSGRGGGSSRGAARGGERGSSRGKGRLFVP
ncbi:hypothetical protein B0A52_02790 [Exophiala mesophila]|uniref:PIN domain-containing protein n=1 Tax=Exophiala mesophila TaxID=212818 RepID=A0A438NDW8_EXOME|nr:hypothetical protein B0A52_02790 [Exophiala mesophila]